LVRSADFSYRWSNTGPTAVANSGHDHLWIGKYKQLLFEQTPLEINGL
jgi:hypothetical protein